MLITQDLPQIVELIGTNPVVSVVANTGSGKSVGIPAAVAATGARCFVTVPTRTAALSLYRYQILLQQAADPSLVINDQNRIVGYAAESVIHYGPETNIAYVTGGHARKKLLSYFVNGVASDIDFCDVLIVDEVHSGSIDNTIIISLWMVAYAAGVKVPRLVIASATPTPIIIIPEPINFTVDIKTYPITYRYLDKDIPSDDPGKTLYVETAKMIINIHINNPISNGHILVFAAGSSEVEMINNMLVDQLKSVNARGKLMTIIPAFGALKREELELIYKKTGPTERKVVIATNIAEMSITINDIGHVVDTMLEKRAETSQSGGFRLSTHYISKDSAKQRAGRTGRTRSGICYRMCTLNTYNTFEDHRPAEIDRVPLFDTVMELLDVGLSPEKVIKGIDPDRTAKAVNLLNRIGMLTTTNNGVLVTNMGHFATKFNISVRNSAFLWHWINYNGQHYTNDIIKLGHELFDINLEYMEIHETSEYSTLKVSHMDQVASIYANEQLNPNNIIDATANVGGDSINFLRLYPNANLYAIELDPKISQILRRNFENLQKILNTRVNYYASAINMSAVDYFSNPRSADIIYFDPPWGGKDYKYQSTIELELDGIGVGVIIGNILREGITPLVILKAPFNVDMGKITTDINLDARVNQYYVYGEGDKIDYQLFFIRSHDIELIPTAVMIQNEPQQVPLRPASYPIFPGIVVASLIDAYGPTYFWTPRRTSEMSPDQYNTMIRQHKEDFFSKFKGYNDLESCLNMWSDLMTPTTDINIKDSIVSNWSRKNSMNNKKIHELLTIVRQSSKTISNMNYSLEIGPFTTNGVMTAARPFLLAVYSDTIMSHIRSTMYSSLTTSEEYKLDTRDAVNELAENPPIGIIAIRTAEIETSIGLSRIVNFAIDTEVDDKGMVIKSKQTRVRTKREPVHEQTRRVISKQRPVQVPKQSLIRDIISSQAFDLLNDITPLQPLTIQPALIESPLINQGIVLTPIIQPPIIQPPIIRPSIIQPPVVQPPVIQPLLLQQSFNKATGIQQSLSKATDIQAINRPPVRQPVNLQAQRGSITTGQVPVNVNAALDLLSSLQF